MTTKKIKYGTKQLAKEFGELTFGNMLEAHRITEDYTQREFAEFLKISPSSLCDLEKGRKIPTISRATCIINKLGVSKTLWIKIVIQDQLRKEDLNYNVSLRAS